MEKKETKVKRRINLPNQITILRMLIVLVIIGLALFYNKSAYFTLFGLDYNVISVCMLGLFIIGSFSDFLDGHLARKNNLVTTFGKFMDPIADKLLVNSMFIILTGLGKIHWLVTVIMVGRDIIVDVIRLIMVERGSVIAASKLGKLKTVTQMVALIFVLAIPGVNWIVYLTYVAAAVSLISGCDYFLKNKTVLLEDVFEKN